MKAYQEKYIENLKRVFELTAVPGSIPDPEEYVALREKRALELREISRENTRMLREELFPLLDDIISASDEDIANLDKFASNLNLRGAYLDLVLCYYLHNALVTYARHWGKRDLLIRQLYNCAMSLFYMQEILRRADRSDYSWKMSLLFGEAASYIKQYDQIEDLETRGYIHRAMGNLALSYAGLDEESGRRKLAAIRRSLQILEDPVYHEKSPGLPWDLYLMKTHQERTTALGLLRAGIVDQEVQREVMASAEYVHESQLAASSARGGKLALRWRYAYEAAQYHCGVRTLPSLLNWMEQVFMERDETDYTPEGMYCNMFLPALYASYLSRSPDYLYNKKVILSFMYRRLEAYVRKMPDHQLSETALNNLLACLQSFVEYPDGIQEKDFILTLVVCRSPDSFADSYLAAQVAVRMVGWLLDHEPEALSSPLAAAQGPAGLRKSLERFAYEACLLHDVGFLAFHNLARRIARGRLEEEEEMVRCHVFAGVSLLSQSPSTQPYVQAALGHHRHYDGRGGYPEEYRRSEDPTAPMTDLVSAAVRLVELLNEAAPLPGALLQMQKEAGTRLNPAMCRALQGLEPELRAYLENGRVEAYEEAFRLLRG